MVCLGGCVFGAKIEYIYFYNCNFQTTYSIKKILIIEENT